MDQSQAPTDDTNQPAQPAELRTLPNGAIYDMSIKRIVAAPPPERQFITQENAKDMHVLAARKRLEAELAAGRGLASVAVSGKSELDAWSDIAANMGGLALQPDPKYGRVSVEAARVVGQMTGFIAERGRNTGELPANTLQITLNNDGLAAIMAGILPILRNSGDDSE